jgi:hypothetical protein
VSRVSTAAGLGLDSLVILTGVFFEAAPHGPKTLRRDYLARWDALVTELQPLIRQVNAFFICDEPTRTNVSPQTLSMVAATVRRTFPTTTQAMTESRFNLSDLVVPADIDWLGLQYYGSPDINTDPAWNAAYQTLLSKRSRPDQMVLLIVDGWWSPDVHGKAGISPDGMAAVATSYGRFAMAHKEISAAAVFIWPNVFGPPVMASSDLPPVVRAAQEAVGRALTGR